MLCKFNESKECIHTELFDKWKDDKKETAYLTLGVCPVCPVYTEDITCEEVNHDKRRKRVSGRNS